MIVFLGPIPICPQPNWRAAIQGKEKHFEDNWHLGRIGDQSFDAVAGSLENMFDFSHPLDKPFFLDPATGLPKRGKKRHRIYKRGTCSLWE